MARDIRNISASVHRRLLDKAKETRRPFNELLQHFAIERFIYRISRSRHAECFILKGALMFFVWGGASARPTMDIDFMGRMDNSLAAVGNAVKDACRTEVEPDGVVFDADSVSSVRITESAEYEGVRVRLKGRLGSARLSLQIDIGFGDALVPCPSRSAYPALLDFPAPVVNGYSMESTIAEKFHAMVKLGILNSRMKDFYDIWMLARTFNFEGARLSESIKQTFECRKTPFVARPAVFAPSFAQEKTKCIQWRAFTKKLGLHDAPQDFETALALIGTFLEPLNTALAEQQNFRGVWSAPGPWC